MAIALCALLFSFYGAWLERDQVRRSSRPEMMMSYFFNQEGSGFLFGNVGLGPARLKWFQILVDGKPQINWADMLHSLGFPTRPEFSFVRPGPTWSADSYIRVFWLSPGPADEKLRAERDRVELSACYCSIFDECWLVTDQAGPRAVDQCEPSPEVTFGGRPGQP